MVDDGFYYFSSYRTERDVMKYWMNLIRKSGRTELVLSIKGLPQDMQDALTAAGLGGEQGALMGAYHAETKNVYIFLPEFARIIKTQNPKIDLDSPRAERLIINKLIAVIEHENLHKVMDDDIKEFAKNLSDDFITQIVQPNILEYIRNIDDSNVAGTLSQIKSQAFSEAMKPAVKNMLYQTGTNLIHEIMVRMVMQYDSGRIIDQITPYIRQYIKEMFEQFSQIIGPVVELFGDDEDVQSLANLMIGSIPNFWGNIMRELFLNNSELIGSFLDFNLEAIMES